DRSEFVATLVDQLAKTEHDRLALRLRQVAPGREGGGCCRNSRTYVGDRCQPEVLRHLAGRRVVDRGGAGGGSGRSLAIDVVVQCFSHFISFLVGSLGLRKASTGSAGLDELDPPRKWRALRRRWSWLRTPRRR